MLARDIESQIRSEVPEYSRDPVGAVEENVQAAVRVGLGVFIAGLGGEQRPDRELDVFRRLGRLEAQSGRSHDTLQMAYRVATHEVANFLALLAHEVGAPIDEYAKVRHAAIAFMEHLAGLSRVGFDDALAVDATEARAIAELLEVLVSPGEPSRSRIVAAAGPVGWPVPERVRALDFHPTTSLRVGALRALRDALGPRLLVGRLRARCVGFLDADLDPGLLTPALPDGAAVVVGPAMQLLDASRSCRIAHRLARRVAAGVCPSGIVLADDLLLDLFSADAADVMLALAQQRLRPLFELSVVKRVKAARVLSAMLEYGGLPRDAPDLSGTSPSTLHYRRSIVEYLFGDALDDRTQRVELLLALRAVLPQWEAELVMHERHRPPTHSTDHRARGMTKHKSGAGGKQKRPAGRRSDKTADQRVDNNS